MNAIHSIAPHSAEEWNSIQTDVPRIKDDEMLRLSRVDFIPRLQGGD